MPDGEVASVGLVRSQNCFQNCFATLSVRKDDSLALLAEIQITVFSVSRVFFVSGGPWLLCYRDLTQEITLGQSETPSYAHRLIRL